MAHKIAKVVYYLCTVLGTKDRCSKFSNHNSLFNGVMACTVCCNKVQTLLIHFKGTLFVYSSTV